MSERRHRGWLAGLIVASVLACWTLPSSGTAFASVDAPERRDGLSACHHVDLRVVARPLRTPTPCDAPRPTTRGMPGDRRALPTWDVRHEHGRPPLYALFRVYRL